MRFKLLTSLGLALVVPTGVIVGQQDLARVVSQSTQVSERPAETEEQPETKDAAATDDAKREFDDMVSKLAKTRPGIQTSDRKDLVPIQVTRMVETTIEGAKVLRPVTETVMVPADQLNTIPSYNFSAPESLPSQNSKNLAFSFNTPGVYAGRRENEGDRQAMELARKYRSTENEEEKKEIRSQLRKLTETTFQQRMDARAVQIQEAQERLDKIKDDLEQRQGLAEKIVDRRVADLLDDPDPLSWQFGGESLPFETERWPASVFPSSNYSEPNFSEPSYSNRLRGMKWYAPAAPAPPSQPATIPQP